MAVTQEFIDQVKEALQTFSDSLENADETGRADFIKTVAEITSAIALPGVRYNKAPVDGSGNVVPGATAEAYVQIPWRVLSDALADMQSEAGRASEAAASASAVIAGAQSAAEAANTAAAEARDKGAAAKAQGDAAEAKGDYAREQGDAAKAKGNAAETQGNVAEQKGNTAEGQGNAAEQKGNYAKDQGDYAKAKGDVAASAARDAQAAAAGAENVNAQLSGMTVTVTNRNGQSASVNIGFEIYRTYGSVSSMNADAANVPDGRFVIIATTDPTDPDNAKLYAKNSQGGFTFLSDLDQASSAAWADWLDNMKPTIEAAISTADADHATAGQDHSTAVSDHATASQQQSTFEANEAARQQAYEDAEDERMANMMLTHCYIDFTTMCLMFVQPEADTTEYKIRNGNLEITFQYEE